MALESLSQIRSVTAPAVSPTDKRCIHCDAGSGVGDYCEACEMWQHPGCCRFCYEHLDLGAAFCHECGNDQTGVACPKCHERSFFDFCSQCFEPLTQRAQQEIAQAIALLDPVIEPVESTQIWQDDDAPVSESVQGAGHPQSAPPPPVVVSSGQQARARIMALRAKLMVTVREPTGWRCNRWSAVHQSPNDCAAPEHGGEWLFD